VAAAEPGMTDGTGSPEADKHRRAILGKLILPSLGGLSLRAMVPSRRYALG